MKKVIIVGASGMVGSIVLRECLRSDAVVSVVSIVRRPSGKKHLKLKEIVHQDFGNFETVVDGFKNIDLAFFCIGVYAGTVSKDRFKLITVDFAVTFGNTLKQYSPDSVICFLSGQGADPSEKSRVAFARFKGMAENHLQSLNFKRLHLFRPSYIYPVEPRKEPNLMYRVSRFIYPLLKRVIPSYTITSEALAQAMVYAGLRGNKLEVLENEDIKEVVT